VNTWSFVPNGFYSWFIIPPEATYSVEEIKVDIVMYISKGTDKIHIKHI